jgi:hypothetical protein
MLVLRAATFGTLPTTIPKVRRNVRILVAPRGRSERTIKTPRPRDENTHLTLILSIFIVLPTSHRRPEGGWR